MTPRKQHVVWLTSMKWLKYGTLAMAGKYNFWRKCANCTICLSDLRRCSGKMSAKICTASWATSYHGRYGFGQQHGRWHRRSIQLDR